MRRPVTSRKQRLRAALTLAGKTLRDFAIDQGVSETHLHLVLARRRNSPRIDAAVDEIIEKYLPQGTA